LEYAVTPEEINEYAQEAVARAHEELGDGACMHDVAIHAVGMSQEDMQAAADYVGECVNTHLFNTAIGSGGMSPKDVVDNVLGVAIPTLLLIGRIIFDGKNSSITDKYLTTVQAEMSLGAMILDKKDLSDIWPAQFVEEICATYTEPHKAFLAGVMCGRSHG
jgi:hypothetical protein